MKVEDGSSSSSSSSSHSCNASSPCEFCDVLRQSVASASLVHLQPSGYEDALNQDPLFSPFPPSLFEDDSEVSRELFLLRQQLTTQIVINNARKARLRAQVPLTDYQFCTR